MHFVSVSASQSLGAQKSVFATAVSTSGAVARHSPNCSPLLFRHSGSSGVAVVVVLADDVALADVRACAGGAVLAGAALPSGLSGFDGSPQETAN